MAALALLFAACGEQGQVPVSSESAATAEVQGIPDGQFEPLRFLGADLRLLPTAKRGQATRVVKAEKGGRVRLKGHIKDDGTHSRIKYQVEVSIQPGALTRDTEISIAMEDPGRSLILEFGEHGTQFRIPAEVTIEAEGLDLSGAGSIDLYWYDPASDAWYVVPKLHLEVDGDDVEGTWLLDHFSRYSLSGGGGR